MTHTAVDAGHETSALARRLAERALQKKCGTTHTSAIKTSIRRPVLWCDRCKAAVDVPPTIALIAGRAVPYGVRNMLTCHDQTGVFETFAPSCFADSIRAGGISLRVNHSDVSSIPCHLACRESIDGLDFCATLPDSPQARHLLACADEISGASIRYRPVRRVPDRRCHHPAMFGSQIVEEGRLVEISILLQPQQPAWFGTAVAVTRLIP